MGRARWAGVCSWAMAPAYLDGPLLTLALVEAQVGSLVEVLPVAVLVTASNGEILRANDAAVELLGNPAPLVGQVVVDVLEFARRRRPLEVHVRWLRHEDDALRLYVIHCGAR
jgi:PAS domain-containing protein